MALTLTRAMRNVFLGVFMMTSGVATADELRGDTVDACEQELDATYVDLALTYEVHADLTDDRLQESSTAVAHHESCPDELEAAFGELNAIHGDLHDVADHDAAPESDDVCIRWCPVSNCGVCVEWGKGGRNNNVVVEEISIVTEIF